MTEEGREEVRGLILEELYMVLREAEVEMEDEARRDPLGAGNRVPRILRYVVDKYFREEHPEAYEKMARMLTEDAEDNEQE